MSQFSDSRYKTFQAGAAIAEGVAVKLSSGKLAACGLADPLFIGWTTKPTFADLDYTTVCLRGPTVKVKAANAVAQGVAVYVRASGLHDDVSTSSAVQAGISLEAAGAANELFEIMPCALS